MASITWEASGSVAVEHGAAPYRERPGELAGACHVAAGTEGIVGSRLAGDTADNKVAVGRSLVRCGLRFLGM